MGMSFLLSMSSRLVVGETLSLGVKRPVCEADHSHPANAEVKDTWIYTSTPPYVVLMSSVNLRDNFTFVSIAGYIA
jgi:hypothetical protein